MNKCSTTRTYYTYIAYILYSCFLFSLKIARSKYKHILRSNMNSGFMKKREGKKPPIGFEPMTYALPWRYSTTELRGPFNRIPE